MPPTVAQRWPSWVDQRRQVHAHQHLAGRGTSDRLRHAGHHARCDLDPFERDGKQYTLIDTAGLRRRGKVFEAVEKFSVVKTLQAIERANVVVLVIDASQDISDQDAHIAGFVLDTGRALVVAVNKWDNTDDYRRERVKQEIGRKLGFLSFARFHYVSALKSQGISALLRSVDGAFAAAMAKLSTHA